MIATVLWPGRHPWRFRRMIGIGYQSLGACMALGVTGPILRSTGYDWYLRKKQPYCGYETYDFELNFNNSF